MQKTCLYQIGVSQISTGDICSVTSSQSSKSFSAHDNSNKFNGMSERQVEDLFEKMLVRRYFFFSLFEQLCIVNQECA